MNHALADLVQQWHLSPAEAALLEQALGRGDERAILGACRDIDRALAGLLADRDAISAWLRTSHRAFYHATPLQLVLGSASGRRLVRAVLLEEAAPDDRAARAALVDHDL